MGKGFRLSDDAEKIVEALREVLGTVVILLDVEAGIAHAKPIDFWYSEPYDPTSGTDTGVRTVINERWSIWVAGREPLAPGAHDMMRWAARKLRPSFEGPSAPQGPASIEGDDDGGSGAAGLGIALSWTRKLWN